MEHSAVHARVIRGIAIAALLSLAAVGHADPACDSAAPRADASAQPPADARPSASQSSSSLDLHATGIALGVGRRISDRLFVGAAGEWNLRSTELALDDDWWFMPYTPAGLYLAAGMSLEPVGAYGIHASDIAAAIWESERTSATLAPGRAYLRDPYFVLGWRFAVE